MAWTLSSAGLVSPATFSNSGNANTMDDYEEGTWSPEPANSGSYTINQATYTKFGKTVFLFWKVTYAATFYPSPQNNAPFTASSFSAGSVYEVAMGSNVGTDNSLFDMIRIDPSGTSMAYNTQERATLGTPQAANGAYAYYQMTYETAS